jgi:hypothetical protein
MRKLKIMAIGIILWGILSILLALFAGIGFFMIFMDLSVIMFVVALYNPVIIEWARGEKYTQEELAGFKGIRDSKRHRLLFFINLVIFILFTIFLLFHNARLIDLIRK